MLQVPVSVHEIVYSVNVLQAKKVKRVLRHAFHQVSDLILLRHLESHELTQPEDLDIISTLLYSSTDLLSTRSQFSRAQIIQLENMRL